MSTLIAGAAPAPDAEPFYRALLASYEIVIAADAAGEWCVGLGRVPDATVGDFDSSVSGAPARLASLGSEVVTAPAAKDESDLDLCVAFARASGASDVAFTACTGGRLDHTLAALGTVLECADLSGRVLEPGMTCRALGPGRHVVAMEPGTTFSAIAPAGAEGVSLEGGEYALANGSLPAMSSLGLSNVSTASEVVVNVGSGTVLLIMIEP